MSSFTRSTMESFFYFHSFMKFRLNNIFLHDVTGITLEQFRILRDTYQVFEPIVFDESVQGTFKKT